MEKRKVGLLLAYKSTNYGAQLQAWATQHVIESLGFDTEIIEYKNRYPFESLNIGHGVLRHLYVSYRNKKVRQRTRRVDKTDELAYNNSVTREGIYKDFIKRRLHNIRFYVGKKDLTENVSTFSAVLIGSDQKWLPGACYGMMSSLSFVPKGVRSISYATSLGVSEYPRYCWRSSMKMWSRMDCLSVREKQGADIIHQICGDIDVSVVVDPTYLLTTQQWEQLVPVKKLSNKEYMLCYFLGNDVQSKEYARQYADRNGLHLISILSNESTSEIDKSFADELITNATPEDFINWIRGAEIVFTDSFHGLTFSVINHKQFYVFYRKRDDAKLSRNSRIDNILTLWRLEQRLIVDYCVQEGKDGEKCSKIDYDIVDKLVSVERTKSMEYLKNALSF